MHLRKARAAEGGEGWPLLLGGHGQTPAEALAEASRDTDYLADVMGDLFERL